MVKRLTAGVLAALTVWPAAAMGQSTLYDRVLHTYQSHGTIPACQFTSHELSSALSSVDTYGQQYYADFIGAIQSALDARASGACSRNHHVNTAGGGGGLPSGPGLPTSITASTSSGPPAALVALGIAAALLAGAAALAAVVRRRPGPSDWDHGWSETGYRMGGLWAALAGRFRR